MLAPQDEIHTTEVTELKRVASELDQAANYQLDHLMSENKSLESQRDSALPDLSLLQTRMYTGTAKIEKGVIDAEGKYNKLKQQYRALELSCDKDL